MWPMGDRGCTRERHSGRRQRSEFVNDDVLCGALENCRSWVGTGDVSDRSQAERTQRVAAHAEGGIHASLDDSFSPHQHGLRLRDGQRARRTLQPGNSGRDEETRGQGRRYRADNGYARADHR